MIGFNVKFSTSLERADNTFIVRIWIWKLCFELVLNIFLDENRDGVKDDGH